MSNTIALAVFLRSKVGQEEALGGRLGELVRASRGDAGVILFELHRSASDAAVWFLYERYASQEHFERHRENPVLRRFVADIPILLEGEMEVRKFKYLGEL